MRPVIAHLLPWENVGGTEWGTLRLVRAVGDEDFRHIAFVPAGATNLNELFLRHGIETESYGRAEPSIRHPVEFGTRSVELSRTLRAHNVDIVHCADLLGAFYVCAAGPISGIPVTTHIRCQHPVISWRNRQFLRHVRHFCFVSHDAAGSFGMRLPQSKSSVVHDGVSMPNGATKPVPIDLRARLALDVDTGLVGMVARVAPAKDFATLFSAMEIVRASHPETRLVVIGDYSTEGSYRAHFEHVRADAHRRGLSDSVHFTGHIAELSGIWDQLRVSVLSTRTEGLPLVVLEAMAAGCPVAATRVGGIPEMITDGVDGFLHEPGDSDTLARHILRLMDEPELRTTIIDRARRTVRERYSESAYGTRMRELFTCWTS